MFFGFVVCCRMVCLVGLVFGIENLVGLGEVVFVIGGFCVVLLFELNFCEILEN